MVAVVAALVVGACDQGRLPPPSAASSAGPPGPPGTSVVVGSPRGGPPAATAAPAPPPPSAGPDLPAVAEVATGGAVAAGSADGSTAGAAPCTRVDHLVDVPVELTAPPTPPGALTARWYSRSSPSLEGYEVALVRDDLVAGAQPAPAWRSVQAPDGCQWLETTFTDLRPGARYQVWLHARRTSPAGAYSGQEWSMVGRSGTVAVG